MMRTVRSFDRCRSSVQGDGVADATAELRGAVPVPSADAACLVDTLPAPVATAVEPGERAG